MDVRRLEWANALRGIAAVLVLVSHYLSVFWLDQPVAASLAHHRPRYAGDDGAPAFARAVDALPIDLAALGVGLFFVLSGFVIAISVDRYTRRGFAVGRALRLLPTYAVGYLLLVLVLALVLRTPGGTGREPQVDQTLVAMVPGLATVLGVDALPDGIVWTLIIELVFYGICLLRFATITRRWQSVVAVAAACVAAQALLTWSPIRAALPGSLDGVVDLALLAAPFVPVMLIGVVVSCYHRGRVGAVTLALVPVLLGVHATLLATSSRVPASVEYRVSFAAAVLVFLVVWQLGDRWRPGRSLRFLADISYPLYVTHGVIGYAVMLVLLEQGLPVPVALLVAVGQALLLAWLLHQVVETPSHRRGQRWARRLRGPAAVQPRERARSSV